MNKRTPPRKKALQLAKYLRYESPDYGYLRTVFMYLRQELEVVVTVQPKKLPSKLTLWKVLNKVKCSG